MKTIKRIDASSLGKVMGLLYGVLGLIGGLVFLVISLVSAATGMHPLTSIGIGVGILLAITIGYGLMGLILGYVMGWIYNFAAKRTGGIKFEVE